MGNTLTGIVGSIMDRNYHLTKRFFN